MSYIETRVFRYVVTVAEERHFARAAGRLGIAPQTLSRQIKKLESQLGARLFERKGNRRVFVTKAGQRFLADAREVLRKTEEAVVIARQAASGELGRLQLGFTAPVFGTGLLSSWIGTFQQAHPAIDIAIRELLPMAQINGILRKDIDAGFTRTPHKYPRGVRGFEVHRQPLVLALPSEHPLARHQAINPAMLAGEEFVNTVPEPDVDFFGHTEAIAKLGHFVARVVKRDADFVTVLTYVALGHGIAVVPESMKWMNFANVVLRAIAADPVPQTSIAFVYGSNPSPSAKLLLRHMRRHAFGTDGSGAAPPPIESPRPKGVPRLVFSRGAS